jgi:NAD-dependent dihydropyrimidine dehydrogenase PreA subunit
MKRKLIKIDESLCDGCGVCIPSCPEGALKIIDGKARLVKESFCDGLGACLGECPLGALTVVDTDTEEYDEAGVIEHIKQNTPDKLNTHIAHLRQHANEIPKPLHHHADHGAGCPSSRMMVFDTPARANISEIVPSQLKQWPIQLHLVSPNAPYFKNADIAFVADCVPLAYGNFQNEFLSKYAIAIGCPKLDDIDSYSEKIKNIILHSRPRSIKVLIMEVPCCTGLLHITKDAVASVQPQIPIEVIVVGIKGDILVRQNIDASAM